MSGRLVLSALLLILSITLVNCKAIASISKRQSNYNFGQDEVNIAQHQQEQQQQAYNNDDQQQQNFDVVFPKDDEPIKTSQDEQQLEQQQPAAYPEKGVGGQKQEPVYPEKNGHKTPVTPDESDQNILPGGQEPQKTGGGGQQPVKGPGEDEQIILPGGQDELEHKPGEPFAFSYQINDNNGSEYSRKEESDGEVITGEYQVLLPDGRLQIVKYTADWKNGYRPTITYVPAEKKPGEDEQDIQPGGQECPKGTKATTSKGGGTKCLGPDETEEDIQPGGFTPKPCPEGTKSVTAKGGGTTCIGPDETEEDIQPGGFTPKPCPDGAKPLANGECPPPEEPPGLYGAPSIPFKVRVNPKFGYSETSEKNKRSTTISQQNISRNQSSKQQRSSSNIKRSIIPLKTWASVGLTRSKDGTFVFSRPY